MFNADLFNSAQIALRQKTIEVPQLSDFFKGKPEWVVRGMTGEEVALVNESQERSRNLENLVDAIASSGSGKRVTDGIKNALGLGDEVPADITRRIEMLILGSVKPVCDREMAIRLSTFFPTVFYDLTNTILTLSGEGGDIVGKPQSSTKEKT